MKYIQKILLASVLPLWAVTGLTAANFTGPDGGNWGEGTNWDTGTVPVASDDVLFAPPEDRSINMDGDYTIKSLTDGFGAGGLTIAGTGTLTIDIAQATTGPGLTNATGNDGNVMLISGNLAINNSGEARTVVRTSNSSANILRFDTGSNLLLTTGLQTQGAIGSIEFNGKVSGSSIFIGSQNASFEEGHDSTELTQIVFFNNGLLRINGGTVLKTGSKFQVNGTNTTLELNSANSVNGANVVVGGSNDLLIDVNANQEDFGFLIVNNGGLTIDVDPSVTNLSFSRTYFQGWGTGTVTINGFQEGTIRFGTDGTGLTREQLAAINGGIYSLTSEGYLTEDTINYWASFEIDEAGYVLLAPWIELYAYAASAPYIWLVGGGWVYMEEEVGVNGYGWSYAYDLASLEIYRSDDSGFGYSFALNHWVYSPDEVAGAPAGWFYVL